MMLFRKKLNVGLIGVLVGVSLVVNSCINNDVEDHSSFEMLQHHVINSSCAISGCHASTADASFVEHGLVLEASVAYENLVNVLPTNALALADGLLRVKPWNAEESLLLHKVHSNYDNHHASNYGNPMPLGLPLLTVGQVEFIEQWIEAGAPKDGNVADVSLLDDTTLQPELFEPLELPENGMQVVIPEFTVAPDFEREFFVYKRLNNAEAMYVDRIEIKMRQNSHHFLLYDFDENISPHIIPAFDVVRDIRKPDGTLDYAKMLPMAYHVFIAGTQTPYYSYDLPEGVAIYFPPDFAIDFNSHYVNKSHSPIPGEVNINLHTVPVEEVESIAQPLNFANNSLTLPANQKTTVSKTFLTDHPISVITLTSHTHKLGEKFVIRITGGARDGEIVYTNLDWHHPPIVTFDPPIHLNSGEGLISVITYNNNTNNTVSFGLTSEDEMGIIFGYFIEE